MSYLKQDKRQLDENGKRHGEWVIYYKNYQLMYRANYVHGIEYGFTEGYYYDGTLWYRGHYNMDRKIGYWYGNNKKSYFLWVI